MPTGRKLKLNRRAERMDDTRRRIARATFELHSTVGPAYTSVLAIAARAGVQRVTVYKHFPLERELHQACVEHGFSLDPPPDPASWLETPDLGLRLRRALNELYSWFWRNEGLLANVSRDLLVVLPRFQGDPPPALVAFMAMPGQLRDALAQGSPASGDAPFMATLGLAVEFQTCHTLAQQGLNVEQSVALMAHLVECAGLNVSR